jgi:type 1 fimbriae regulatory protein FimB
VNTNAAAEIISMPRQRAPQHRGEREYLTTEEIKRFMKAAKEYGVREHAMFRFALSHGARAVEICNLRISDLDMDRDRVNIARVKNSDPSLQVFQPLERTALLKWLKVRKAERPDDFVFTSRKHSSRLVCDAHLNGCPAEAQTTNPCVGIQRNETSNRLNPATVYRLFSEIAEKAEIPENKRHPHVLKHSLAQMLLASGENAFVIQKALGHKSISSTLAYSKPTNAQASDAIAKAGKGIL